MVAPQLSADLLIGCEYQPVGNPHLRCAAAHFPAIPLVNAYVKTEERIKVITVTNNTSNCHRNLELLKSEAMHVCETKGVWCDIESIEVPFDDSI